MPCLRSASLWYGFALLRVPSAERGYGGSHFSEMLSGQFPRATPLSDFSGPASSKFSLTAFIFLLLVTFLVTTS